MRQRLEVQCEGQREELLQLGRLPSRLAVVRCAGGGLLLAPLASLISGGGSMRSSLGGGEHADAAADAASGRDGWEWSGTN
jgi:hypothetical protein